MKPFDSLAPNAIPTMIRAPVTLQGFEMLPKGMTHGAGVWSAAPGMKSYEIPPLARSAAGALGERANRGAKSSGGCGCGGGCGPCGGAKASPMGSASGAAGAGAVMRAPAVLRGVEMLPQGMSTGARLSSGAGGMRGYEILPNAKVVGEGLMAAPRALRAYEMMPGAGMVTRELRKRDVGCLGNCGKSGSRGAAGERDFRFSTPSSLTERDVHVATTFDPPILRGGGDRSTCDLIIRQIESLIAEYFRNRTRCQGYRDIWSQCFRGTGPVPCFSYQIENDALAAQDRELVAQWEAAPDGPEGNAERRRVDLLRDAISSYRTNVLRPAQVLCDMTVADDINARNNECLRMERYVQDCTLDTRIRGEDLIKALENYVAWAQRIGCDIGQGLYERIDWTVGIINGGIANPTGIHLGSQEDTFRERGRIYPYVPF